MSSATATDKDVAFLAAICANPADDTPRLVYADWLDEHGQPERAEFVRVQCELARLEAACVCPPLGPPEGGVRLARLCDSCAANVRRLDALRGREADLLAAHGYDFLEPRRPEPFVFVA